MPIPSPLDIAAALAAHERVPWGPLPGRTNHLEAGIAVPIRWGPEPTVLATLRPDHLHRHAGEICFPGGRPEPSDRNLWHTARREAAEELGLHKLERLGELSTMPVYTSDYRLVPYVVETRDRALVPDPNEVAQVLHLPLGALAEAETCPALEWTSPKGVSHLSPYFVTAGHVMFGATAHVLWELVELVAPLFGAATPQLVKGPLGWEDVLPSTLPAG